MQQLVEVCRYKLNASDLFIFFFSPLLKSGERERVSVEKGD